MIALLGTFTASMGTFITLKRTFIALIGTFTSVLGTFIALLVRFTAMLRAYNPRELYRGNIRTVAVNGTHLHLEQVNGVLRATKVYWRIIKGE
jgi:hypothetical protein